MLHSTLPGFRVFAFLLALGSGAALAVPELPSTLLLTGKVSAGPASPGVVPVDGDTVLIFALADGRLVGSGQVGGGEYAAVATQTVSFNGQPVVVELQQGRNRYALVRSDGSLTMPFQGAVLPDRTRLDLRVGRKTATLSAEEAATVAAQRLSRHADLPCDALADVNEDGRCDGDDEAILRLYSGGVSRTVARP